LNAYFFKCSGSEIPSQPRLWSQVTLNRFKLFDRLCYRTTRASPVELMGWSISLVGLEVDLKNEFLSYFPNFNYEGGVLCKNETSLTGFGMPVEDSNFENESPPGRIRRSSQMFVEPLMFSTATRYLNRLSKMGFSVVSSTVDSSVENNYNKKCYVWTLQTTPTQFVEELKM